MSDNFLEKALCVLGLGSNRPYKNFSCIELIDSAAAELQKPLENFRLSPFYKTEAMYVTSQAPFINAAVSGFFSIDKKLSNAESAISAAQKLLEIIQKIESKYGRDRAREQRWGERTLDIDILLFGDLKITETNLIIPHPRLKERAFALRPLLDLLPGAADPETGIKYSEILAALPLQEIALIP